MSVHALVLLAGVEEQHPRALCLVLLQQRAGLAKLRARALVRQPLRRREGSDKWWQDWLERHGAGSRRRAWNSELKWSKPHIRGATAWRALAWLLAQCAWPLGTGRAVICQPPTLVRPRQSIVSARSMRTPLLWQVERRLARSVIRARSRAREIEAGRARARPPASADGPEHPDHAPRPLRPLTFSRL